MCTVCSETLTRAVPPIHVYDRTDMQTSIIDFCRLPTPKKDEGVENVDGWAMRPSHVCLFRVMGLTRMMMQVIMIYKYFVSYLKDFFLKDQG
jgi:hypothetical protein